MSEDEQEDNTLSAFQIKERKERTVFVGNVPLDTNRKSLEKLFGKYGEIEKTWFRSIACDHESKLPYKAKVIKQQFGQQKDNKNAYVLYKTKEEALKASQEMNQTLVGNKHIRVDLDSKPEGQENDYESTIFIGNLPWVLNEEDLRKHFEEAGTITNVRIIRDKDTFIGKGIAYICFATPEDMKKAMTTKNNSVFKGRILRVKRATPTERRDKKQTKKRDMKAKVKEVKREEKQKYIEKNVTPQTEVTEAVKVKETRVRKVDDETRTAQRKLRKKMKKEKKLLAKEKSTILEKVFKPQEIKFMEQARNSMKTNDENIKFENRISLKKKEKIKVLEEMIESKDGKTSRHQNMKNKIFKEVPTLNEFFKKKRSLRKKQNTEKFNKIKIKKAE